MNTSVECADVESCSERFLRFFARTHLRLTQPPLHRFAKPRSVYWMNQIVIGRGRRQMTDDRGQKSGVRGRSTGGQRSEVRDKRQKSEVRRQVIRLHKASADAWLWRDKPACQGGQR